MTAAVLAELRKIRTARMLLAFPMACVAFAVLMVAMAFALPEAERRALPGDALVGMARGPAFQVAVAMLLLGVLVSAGEFRHGTATATLLVTPRRVPAYAAKAVAMAVAAAVTALATTGLAVGLGLLFLRAHDVRLDAGVWPVVATALGTAAAAVLYGLVGVGIGMALRDQTGGIALALGWLGLAEGVIPVVLRKPWLFKWMPSGAANSLLGAGDPPPDLLPAWGAGLILSAVAAVLLGLGAAVFTSRDVA